MLKLHEYFQHFLHWAKERNYYSGNVYDKLKADEPEKEVIFMQLEDLLTFMNYDFNNLRLNKVRDLYCFSCFTGLRYSDIVSLKFEHINGKILTKTQKKTGQVNSIPLNDLALEILKRNAGNEYPLIRMSIQKLNDYIKECCGIIASKQLPLKGFNRKVLKKKVIGSDIIEEALLQYDIFKNKMYLSPFHK